MSLFKTMRTNQAWPPSTTGFVCSATTRVQDGRIPFDWVANIKQTRRKCRPPNWRRSAVGVPFFNRALAKLATMPMTPLKLSGPSNFLQNETIAIGRDGLIESNIVAYSDVHDARHEILFVFSGHHRARHLTCCSFCMIYVLPPPPPSTLLRPRSKFTQIRLTTAATTTTEAASQVEAEAAKVVVAFEMGHQQFRLILYR